MEFIITLLFIIAIFVILFVINYWWVLLIFVAIAAFVGVLVFVVEYKQLQRVVTARIISEEPIIQTISEKTGHTKSYGRYYSYHEHYRDRDVITGYNVKFAVEYENGKKDTITCKRDGSTYNKLIAKIERV